METLFEKLLLQKLREMFVIRAEILTDKGVNDFSDYKFNLGYLHALRDIEDTCDEIREEMNK